MRDSYRLHGSPPYKAAAVHGGPGAAGSAYLLAAGMSQFIGTIEPFQTQKTINDQVDELHSQLRKITSLPLIIVGHSWGAWLAYVLAYMYPKAVRKVIMIGSGALDEKYVGEMNKKRLKRLSDKEKQDFQGIGKELSKAEGKVKENLLKRLGEIAEKADSYDLEYELSEEHQTDLDSDIYRSAWRDGERLRREGYFGKIASMIKCPIRVIHGDNDSTPIEGIIEPLKAGLSDLKTFQISKCGHYPWKEKYGKTAFWDVIKEEIKEEYA